MRNPIGDTCDSILSAVFPVVAHINEGSVIVYTAMRRAGRLLSSSFG